METKLGIANRDLKPENLILNIKNNAYIIVDWGEAIKINE